MCLVLLLILKICAAGAPPERARLGEHRWLSIVRPLTCTVTDSVIGKDLTGCEVLAAFCGRGIISARPRHGPMLSSLGTGALLVLLAAGPRIGEPLGLNIFDLDFVGRTTEAESQCARGRRGHGSTPVRHPRGTALCASPLVAGSVR